MRRRSILAPALLFQSGNRIPRASNGLALCHRHNGLEVSIRQPDPQSFELKHNAHYDTPLLVSIRQPDPQSFERVQQYQRGVAYRFQSGNRIPRASNMQAHGVRCGFGISFNPATGSPELRTPDVTDRTGMRRKHRKSSTAHKLRPMTICYYYSTSTMALECSILHASDSRHLCLSFAARFTVRQ